MKQNMKIKLEWEKEQQRLKNLQLAKEKELEEKRILQEKRDKKLLDFLEQGGDTPDYLKTTMETNPGKEPCPFFQKVSACRFFDSCSRNHIRPGISKTLLISNFFTDISLQIKENEHGSDSSLEFEKADTYKHYTEFFYDVVSELEKCGRIKNFVTCCNHEAHLRGNVYVRYKTEREALITYHKFNCRWYGGKQLNVEFCNINNWKRAICGLFFRNRCPKGNTCNFLHAFRNPKGLYFNFESENNDSVRSSRRTKRDNEEEWDHVVISERRHAMRWSESPERIPSSYHRNESKDSLNDERNSRRSHHHHGYKKDLEEKLTGSKKRSRKRSRSKSSSRKSSHRKRNKRSKRKTSPSSSDNDDEK